MSPFIPDDFGEITNNCDSFPYGEFGFWQRSASCDAIINAWSAFDDEYVEKKRSFSMIISIKHFY